MNKVFKKVPIPMAGLMLALAATGNLVLSYGEVYRNIFGILASIILIFILGKLIIDFKDVLENLKNPVMASIAPTFTMGIMILSTYINKLSSSVALSIWVIGLVLHIILIVYFTLKFILKFDVNKVLPSYFIVYVGIVVGSITAPAYNLAKVGQGLFWFGLVSYAILLPIVIYKVFVIKKIQEPLKPILIIFAAPASLCLAGYLASFPEKNMTIVGILAVLSLIMYLGSLVILPKLLKLKFYPSYSAFTFPLVISAIAIKQTNGFLIKKGTEIVLLKYVVYFETIVAVLIVAYVFYKYMKFLFAGNVQEKVAK
ncbi:exfoliative toxin A/B [Clostridium collagenovorans DSM 3089]|uniref:Exfoliative toxin A/B n=1 Tax=Clostridium collagenovorans DSM 3089 TaxID=1121306 RepID=A0A1M5Y3F9_9CLOT|nr:TDT family transporter [Clostridium collagenovorans]SHI06610.1 exfoliative toxin A/B [Clostridium collagenovorans DSM 3089]